MANRKYPAPCSNRRCSGLVVSEASKNTLCPKCRWHRWVDRNPLAAAFKTLRNHAKERGKDFTITLEHFRQFAEKTDYLKRKGKTSLSLHVDRICETRGYHNDNISAITLAENNRKKWVAYFQEQQYADSIREEIENGIL